MTMRLTTIDRGELAGQRAADIAGAEDHRRRTRAVFYRSTGVRHGFCERSTDGGDMSRAVLITGGTRGIGFAVAEALLKAGDKVAITGTTADGVVKAEHALSAGGRRWSASSATCAIRRRRSARSRRVVAKFGGLDVLVNSAGVGVGVPSRRDAARRMGPHHRHEPDRRVQLLQGRDSAPARRAAADGSSTSRAWRRPIRFPAARPTARRRPA